MFDFLPEDIKRWAAQRNAQWDKPLSEQPKAVRDIINAVQEQRAVQGAAKGYRPLKLSDIKTDSQGNPVADMTGGQAFNYLAATRYSSPDEAAKVLANAGIPGLSYLDAGSRPFRDDAIRGVARVQAKLDRLRSSGANASLISDAEQELASAKRAVGDLTMNHVIWDQALLDRMKPTPVGGLLRKAEEQ